MDVEITVEVVRELSILRFALGLIVPVAAFFALTIFVYSRDYPEPAAATALVCAILVPTVVFSFLAKPPEDVPAWYDRVLHTDAYEISDVAVERAIADTYGLEVAADLDEFVAPPHLYDPSDPPRLLVGTDGGDTRVCQFLFTGQPLTDDRFYQYSEGSYPIERTYSTSDFDLDELSGPHEAVLLCDGEEPPTDQGRLIER